MASADTSRDQSTHEHDFYQDLTTTWGPTRGRQPGCVICLENMTNEEKTITHNDGRCMNAFHETCFQLLIQDALNDSFRQGKLHCPLCRAEILPWPEFGPNVFADTAAAQLRRSREQEVEDILEIILEMPELDPILIDTMVMTFSPSRLTQVSPAGSSPSSFSMSISTGTTPLLASSASSISLDPLTDDSTELFIFDSSGLLHNDDPPSTLASLLTSIWHQDAVILIEEILFFLSSSRAQRALSHTSALPYLLDLGHNPIDRPADYINSSITLYTLLEGIDLQFPLDITALTHRWMYGRRLLVLRDVAAAAIDGVLELPSRVAAAHQPYTRNTNENASRRRRRAARRRRVRERRRRAGDNNTNASSSAGRRRTTFRIPSV